MKSKTLGLFLGLAFVSGLNAATMSVNLGVAPTVDGADIAMLTGLDDIGGNEGHAWSNRPRQGQAFVTGSNPLGYNLNSYTVRVRVDQASTTSPNWEVRVNDISFPGLSPTTIATENAAGVAIPQSQVGNNYPSYVTISFDSPVFLAPNTLYGVDVYPNGGGFISLGDAAGDQTFGAAYSAESPGSAAVPADPLTARAGNRHFHADIDAIPEPSSALLGLLGLVFMARRRR